MADGAPDFKETARIAQSKFDQSYALLAAHSKIVHVATAFACYAAYKFRAQSDPPSARSLPFPASMEFAAWNLFPLMNEGGSDNPEHIQKFIELLEELEQAHMSLEFLASLANRSEDEGIQSHVEIFSSYVRGSAYPQQIEERISACFAGVETEIFALTGTTPIKIAHLIRTLSYLLVSNLNQMSEKVRAAYSNLELEQTVNNEVSETLEGELVKELKTLNGAWIPTWQQVSRDPIYKEADWSALRENIGLTVTSRLQTTRLVDVQDRPIVFPSDYQAFFASGTQALDAAFAWFDGLARDSSDLRDRYVRNVADWMEDKIEGYCLRLFPASAVIKSAVYADPDHPGGEAEADCIVLWGPFLLIFEAKASRVESAGLRGNRKKLKKLISKNIQDAFAQAQRVVRALEINGQLQFRDKITGRTLLAVRKNLFGIFPISVTLQHLLGIPTQLAAAQELGLFKGNAYPWSVSIDDLETITRFVGWADAFIHYIKRRTEHQTVKLSISGDELDIFGHYLDNRLHPEIYEERPEILAHDGESHITFDGGEERFGKIYEAEWSGNPTTSEGVGLNLPESINSILTELRTGNDNDARWIAFSLLSLSQGMLQRIGFTVEESRQALCHPGKTIRRTALDGDTLVNVIVGNSIDTEQFKYDLLVRTRIEHYRRKPKASVTLGINQQSERVFEHVIWFEGDAGIEPAMERLLEKERMLSKIVQVTGRDKIPGRNSLCPCGSGAKFKHCCIDTMRFDVGHGSVASS